MKLPNADAAEVSQEKIKGYLLNPLHPDGAGKAKFFASLGFSIEQWEVLATALQQLATTTTVTNSMHRVIARPEIYC